MKIHSNKNLNFQLTSYFLGLISGGVIVSLLVLLVLNFGGTNPPSQNVAQVSSSLSEENQAEVSAYLRFKEIKASLIPVGVPDVYGEELNISFDAIQEAINKVAPFGPTYGEKKITLAGIDLERYINIGSRTACQYCCEATTLVFENGEAACGCAHSQMMRGLAAYLIKNHPELSDERILEELNTWRASYFPKQTLTQKLQEMKEAGEPGIGQLLEEFPEFMPQMVGGC